MNSQLLYSTFESALQLLYKAKAEASSNPQGHVQSGIPHGEDQERGHHRNLRRKKPSQKWL